MGYTGPILYIRFHSLLENGMACIKGEVDRISILKLSKFVILLHLKYAMSLIINNENICTDSLTAC